MHSSAGPVHVIGHILVKDAARWDDYRSRVAATLVPWQGEVVLRGRRVLRLCGDSPHTDIVLLRFPDAASASGWYHSAAYQALIPIREQAAEVVLAGYEG